MKTSILSVAHNVSSTILRFRRVVLLLVVCGVVAFVTLMRVSSAAVVPPRQLNVNSAADVPVFEVNSTADTDDGACTPPGTGNGCTLREAINAANAAAGAEQITFNASLTASGPTSINLSTGILLFSDMTITGPGANLLTVQRSTAPGTIGFRIFEVGGTRTVTISNLTIANGVTIGAPAGAGIWNKGRLTLNNCNFYNNTAGPTPNIGAGGAIYNEGPSLVLNNCNIGGLGPGQANQAMAFGGGIFDVVGTLVMNGGSIVGNSGGGIAMAGATLRGVSITNNTQNFGGGAGVNVLGRTLIENCLIANNTATDASADGGGVRNGLGILTIVNSTITGNRAKGPGGGVRNFNGQMFLTNVTITDNRSDSDANSFGAENGGGVNGSVFINNSIVVGNSMGSDANPIANDISHAADLSSSFNLIGVCDLCDLTNGVNNNQLGVNNAGLGPLANNGGPTLTYALLSGSPALDAGSNALVAAPPFSGPPFTDQRGFSRIADGPDADVTATVDIGAFEQQAALAQLADAVTNEDTGLIVPFHVGDRSGITSITATSSNQTLVPNNLNNLKVTDAGSTELIVINPAADLNGTTDITVTVNTTGGSTSRTFAVTVNPVNDAPVNHLPQQQSVAENNVLTFSSSNSNAITISDVDAGSAVVEVTLTVNNGVLTLGTPVGLVFVMGDGVADAKLQFRGPIATINTALNGLIYAPNQTFSGFSTLEITTDDLGATGAGTSLQDADSLNLNVVEDGGPVLLTEEGTQRAVALDSVVQTRDPFSLLNFFNFSNDHHRRISLFVWRLGLLPTDTAANITATAEDDQGHVYPLTVEFVGMLSDPPDVAQINVVLPDNVVGAPRDLLVRVQLRGPASNKASIAITAP